MVFAEKAHEWPAAMGFQAIFHMRWDCVARTLTSDLQFSSSMEDSIAEQYPEGIRVVSTDNTAMLLENNERKLAMYPDTDLSLSSHFETLYDGRRYEFVFDYLTNQYWLVNLCIDK